MHGEPLERSTASLGAATLATRLVRYADLAPCRNAFVDTRTPGSDAKENFTIVGPGVSENPNQHVHIPEPHGFNIGAARQPPGCLNSQHSHLTAEVFVVHTGHWRFRYGVEGEDGTVDLGPGDTISIPPRMFRGFENVGADTGFLFAVLGGDDPGRVTWAPRVFELAAEYGLVLLKGGRLVDTTVGETVPEGAEREPPPSAAELAALATPEAARLERCVAGAAALRADPLSPLAADGVEDAPVIVDDGPVGGSADGPADGLADGAIHGWWPHGFELRRVTLAPGACVASHASEVPEVLFVHDGALAVTLPEGTLRAGTGDTLSVPVGASRSWANAADTVTSVYRVRGTAGAAG